MDTAGIGDCIFFTSEASTLRVGFDEGLDRPLLILNTSFGKDLVAFDTFRDVFGTITAMVTREMDWQSYSGFSGSGKKVPFAQWMAELEENYSTTKK